MESPDQHPPVVLVVEDVPAVLHFLTDVLNRHGFDVRTAQRGADAVEMYRQGGIDVVLLDVQMRLPWDGPAILAALKEADADVRVVFMSGGIGAHTVEGLLALGAARVFAKPFPRLADLIAALLELSRRPRPSGEGA